MTRAFRMVAALMMLTSMPAVHAAVIVSNAWSRATPPGTSVGVVYATIVAEQADELVSIDTPIADRAEVHISVNEGGTMKMRLMTPLSLRSNKPLELKPNGMHVMLFDLRKPLTAGESFSLTFRFRNAAPLSVMCNVVGPGDAAPAG